MQLNEAQAQLLKTWIVKKLEDISDVDSDVLADYVLALVRGDDNPALVRQNCITELKDFLQDVTDKFVDEVLAVVQSGAYDPNRSALKAAPPKEPAGSGTRKRAYDDRDDGTSSSNRHGSRGDRPVKQPRRGGRGGFDRNEGWHSQQQWQTPPFQPGAIPSMNPQDAFAALVAMQQAMGLPALPGMAQFPNQGGRPGGHDKRKSKRRCRDYDKKGFCERGAACPYEHGTAAVVLGPGDEYDPTQAALLPEPTRSGRIDAASTRGQGNTRGRGRGRGDQDRGNRRRADFSLAGPSQDKSLTALVVEQIPEDKFEELQVREFFAQYGNIQRVDMQPYKRLAVVAFDTWEEANAAYTSPKVIFDNRFVKVFWYQPNADKLNGTAQDRDSADKDTEMKVDEPEINHEEIAKRQEEAQRKHEEAKKQREEAQKQKSDIEAKLKAMDAERKKFAELLANKTKTVKPEAVSNESEQTKGLKAQLAKLEAEAKSLGIDPDAAASNDWQDQSTWRGRGGYRGRGRFPTRASFRGAWSGASPRGGAVKRLDNRPKTLAVQFAKGRFDDYDEALKQYLLFSDNLEHATLSRHPDRVDSAMIAFSERYRAEIFMAAIKGPSGIPNVGTVEVAWMANQSMPTAVIDSTDAMIEDTPGNASEPVAVADGEADYDVAEDDRWA